LEKPVLFSRFGFTRKSVILFPEPAEGNFGEGNVCTGVDPQERARIANVLALETAVQEEENALQAEKIERLQVMLEQSITIILCLLPFFLS
jgi:hypothetical protein